MLKFFSKVDNDAFLHCESNKIQQNVAKYEIASSSHQFDEIAELLANNGGTFYDQNGNQIIGKAQYIAMHKSRGGDPTPFVHTVLLKDSSAAKIQPLFLRGKKVCLGTSSVGAGSILDFKRDITTVTSSNVHDLFSKPIHITKVMESKAPGKKMFCSLNEFRLMWRALIRSGTGGGSYSREFKRHAGKGTYVIVVDGYEEGDSEEIKFTFTICKDSYKYPELKFVVDFKCSAVDDEYIKNEIFKVFCKYVEFV